MQSVELVQFSAAVPSLRFYTGNLDARWYSRNHHRCGYAINRTQVSSAS